MAEEFRALLQREYGLELSEKAALEAATRLMQAHYLLAYAHRDLRPKIHRERRAPGPEPGRPDIRPNPPRREGESPRGRGVPGIEVGQDARRATGVRAAQKED